MEDFIPLVQTLNELSESDTAAYGLLKRMNEAHFVGLVFILHAILPILGRISRLFQKGYVNFSAVSPTLECAISELKEISESKSPINAAKEELKPGGRLELLDISIGGHAEVQLGQTLCNYIKALTDNIEKRFPDIPILMALNIFNPLLILEKKSPEFRNYGVESISIIHEQFFDTADSKLEELTAEWNLLKFHLLKKKANVPEIEGLTVLEWCLSEVMKCKHEYSYMCPHLVGLVEVILTLPVSNAWPERGASRVKIIKTDLRNRLKNDMINGLLNVAVNGPELCSDECDQLVISTVSNWRKSKNRRKLPVAVARGIKFDLLLVESLYRGDTGNWY